MEIAIRHPKAEDHAEWSRMRAALWPETSEESHAEEIAAFLTGNLTGWLAGLHTVAAFIAVRPGGSLCGFLEASVRPMADGCTTHPVGYIEGWYVDPDVRQQGVGRALLKAAEEWATSRGCREMASDAHLANAVSIAGHRALGFDEESPTVRFRKWLPATGGLERRITADLRLTLTVVPGIFAVCRLDSNEAVPVWATSGNFFSVTRTADELSVVCQQEMVPEGVWCESGWRCLRVVGTLDFSLVGILASLLTPLATAGVSVFSLSTYDTDYLLVKERSLEVSVEALRRAGNSIRSVE